MEEVIDAGFYCETRISRVTPRARRPCHFSKLHQNLEREKSDEDEFDWYGGGFDIDGGAPLGLVAGTWGGHTRQRAQGKDEYRLEGPFTQAPSVITVYPGV